MASFTVPCPKVVPLVAATTQSTQRRQPTASFPRFDSRSNYALKTIAQSQGSSRGQSDVFKVCAQLNDVAVEKISNANSATESALFGTSEGENKVDASSMSQGENEVSDASSFSTFMTQVTDLVKLVDSRDIVELQLKQMDYELLIRKKEAMPQPSIPATMYAPPPTYQAMLPQQLPPASAPAPAPAASGPSPAPALALPAPAKPKSSHPPFKCPMAGSFYRCPAPGAPPFVKVGDKVQKGQVLCIIEAMKLMNEIEADRAGTITEILVDDGKPVSVDMPLFIIEP